MNKLTIEDCKVMVEKGTSLEVVHRLHKETITCPLCSGEAPQWDELKKKMEEKSKL